MDNDIDWGDALQITEMSFSGFSCLAILLIAVILFYYIRAREKQIISLSSYFVATGILLSVIIFAPLAYSPINSIAVGNSYYGIVENLNKAIVITTIGSILFIFGLFCSLYLQPPTHAIETVSKSIEGFWLSRSIVILAFLFLSIMIVFLLGLGATFGDARSFALANKSVTFLFNFYNEFASFCLFNSVVYAGYTKRRIDLFLAFITFILTLFLGTRASSLLILLLAALTLAICNRYNKIIKPLLVIFVMLLFAVFIALIRDARLDSASITTVLAAILFGNNFSDVRDFAWLLSGWDGQLLYGKTIGAAFLSFIPSAIFPERTIWGWSVFSGNASGLDPLVHPGLRPGFFGEIYFNFGLIGVCSLAWLAGLHIGFMSKISEKTAMLTGVISRKKLFSIVYTSVTLGFMVYYFFNSAGFFGFYLKMTLIIIGYIISKNRIKDNVLAIRTNPISR